jgi:hypothetical protein
MKQKAILVSFIALFAIVLALSTVSAFADIDDVIVNDISVVSNTAAGEVSNTVPVEVKFTANENVDDVRVKVYIEGYRDEISDSTSRFRIVEGSTYIKRFSLDLPSSMDLDEDPEALDLYVRISAKGEEAVEELYPIIMQRDLYGLTLLSIEAPETVTAGSVIAIDVVLHNSGSDRLDDTYVRVSIPGVVERNVYFGDIAADVDEDYDFIRDTVNKRIYLTIPSNAISGTYNLEVEAYNYDSDVIAKKQIVLSGIEADDEDDEDDVEVIDGDETETNNTVLILTVILAIIFVVLLIILIVLLTKKPSEIEEFNEGDETSYY